MQAGNAVGVAAQHVDAAEIDPRLVELSRRINASGVYDDPRVTVQINDARAFFRRADKGYDAVVFGFLDSQALFSHSSNIRLDGYIYTVREHAAAAWSLLSDDGILSLSFVTATDFGSRTSFTKWSPTPRGIEPVVYIRGIQTIICAFRGKTRRTAAFESAGSRRVYIPATTIDLPTDDWPYLYLAGRTIPTDYLIVIVTLVILSVAAVAPLRGKSVSRNDGPLLFSGHGVSVAGKPRALPIARCTSGPPGS